MIPDTTTFDEIEALKHKLRMIISHASGGRLSGEKAINRSINDICVQISAHKNEIYADGKLIGFKAGFKRSDSPPPSDDKIMEAFEEWKGTWT